MTNVVDVGAVGCGCPRSALRRIAVLWLVGYPSMASRDCARSCWYKGCQEEFSLRARDGGRCRPGSLALGVGQLSVIHTPWVAISVVSSVADFSLSSPPPLPSHRGGDLSTKMALFRDLQTQSSHQN